MRQFVVRNYCKLFYPTKTKMKLTTRIQSNRSKLRIMSQGAALLKPSVLSVNRLTRLASEETIRMIEQSMEKKKLNHTH